MNYSTHNTSLLYIIQCHKNIEQIKELINTLNIDDTDYIVIHVDKKNSALKHELKKTYNMIENIIVIDDPIRVNWSGFSQVLATLKCFKYAIDNNLKFDYGILLSGEDAPIRESSKLKYFLKVNKTSFIEYRQEHRYSWRINRYNYFRECSCNRSLSIRILSKVIDVLQRLFPARKNFDENEIYVGSSWFVLKRDHMRCILDYISINNGFIDKFKYTSCADEHFFQMLLSRMDFFNSIKNKNLHKIFFKKGCKNPRYLTLDDIKQITEPDVFFVRKVNLYVLSELNKKRYE